MAQDIPVFPPRIVFFDGVCHFCNKSVKRIQKNDRRKRFHYAPLQGETARHLLPGQDPETPSSIIYIRNGKTYYRSTAVLFIALDMDGAWKLFAVLLIVPSFLRDLVYNFVAARRYRWFGRYESCTLPGAEEKAQYLP